MKRHKLTEGGLYLFEWDDVYTQNGWHSPEEIEEKLLGTSLHKSVGFLVKETPDWYVLASHTNTIPGFKPWASVSWLPKGAVRKAIRLSCPR